jgi:AcrR family transcriptional regulator
MKRQAKSEKAQETKAAILEATAHILIKNGLEKVSTNLIAEKAGVSIGSLYQYYENKEDIYEDLLLQLIEKRQQRIRAVLDLQVVTDSIPISVSKVVDAIFEADDNDIRLESLLVPLFSSTMGKKKLLQKVNSLEIFLKPLLKTLFAVKNPKLLKRDLDVVVFVLINAMRGVLLGTSLMLEQNHTKEKLKSELNFLILTYLEAMT